MFFNMMMGQISLTINKCKWLILDGFGSVPLRVIISFWPIALSVLPIIFTYSNMTDPTILYSKASIWAPMTTTMLLFLTMISIYPSPHSLVKRFKYIAPMVILVYGKLQQLQVHYHLPRLFELPEISGTFLWFLPLPQAPISMKSLGKLSHYFSMFPNLGEESS